MRFDADKLKIQLKIAEGELKYFMNAARNSVQTQTRVANESKTQEFAFKDAVESLIRAENLQQLYEFALNYVSSAITGIEGFKQKQLMDDHKRIIASFQLMAPKLQSEAFKLCTKMLVDQFKAQSPDLIEQEVKLAAIENVDQKFVNFRCQQMLGNDDRVMGLADL